MKLGLNHFPLLNFLCDIARQHTCACPQELQLIENISESICFIVYNIYVCIILIRPPDIVVGGLRFYRDYLLVRIFFFLRQLLSELAEWNSTKTGHMVKSECDLEMKERKKEKKEVRLKFGHLRYTLPYNRGPKPLFDDFTAQRET